MHWRRGVHWQMFSQAVGRAQLSQVQSSWSNLQNAQEWRDFWAQAFQSQRRGITLCTLSMEYLYNNPSFFISQMLPCLCVNNKWKDLHDNKSTILALASFWFLELNNRDKNKWFLVFSNNSWRTRRLKLLELCTLFSHGDKILDCFTQLVLFHL